uniref:Uncharacterized protein n=1 Tax=Parascaris univalens TaxID=6257 RepID=A0A914ZST2_PARUN
MCTVMTMVALLSFCASFQCCRRKVKKEESEEPYGVISISDRSSISDRVVSHVSFRSPDISGARNGERFSQPNLPQSGTRSQHSLQRSSVPPSQPHHSTKRALPKLPALEGATPNAMYSSIERQSSSKPRLRSPYIEEGVNPTYESIDAESDSVSDPLYSKLESENASGRKYDYPIFGRSRTARGMNNDEAVYQSASQIYAGASEDPYSSITSQRGGEVSADPGYALVKEDTRKGSSKNDTAANVRPSTSHSAEDLYTKIQRGVTSDLGDVSKKIRDDGQSMSYAAESNQLGDYVASDGEKTSREPSYRYITVRESVDVIRRRLNEREGIDGGTRSAVGSADGSLPVREHYYSSIGGGSDYESVSVGALYERIAESSAANAENGQHALPKKTADSFDPSVNAFGQMPSTSACVTIASPNDIDRTIPPKPPTSPIPSRSSEEAPDLISPVLYSTDRKRMFLVENSPPYASVLNDHCHASDSATVNSTSSGVRTLIRPKMIVENSSGKSDVKKQQTSGFFSIKLDEASPSLHASMTVPPQKQSNSSPFTILERKKNNELRGTTPEGLMRETDLWTSADSVKDDRSLPFSSINEAHNIGFIGRNDPHRSIGEVSSKIDREHFAHAKGGSHRFSTSDDRPVFRNGTSTSNDLVLRNAHFISETFVLPSAPYRTANRSPENVLESEGVEIAQERSTQVTSIEKFSEAPASIISSTQDSSDHHIDALPAETILEKKNEEEKQATIIVQRTSSKGSEAVDETSPDSAEHIVPIELIPSNSTAFISEVHMRPSQSGSFTDRSSQPTFRSEVETYITMSASVPRSVPIEIGTESADTSDIENGLMNRSFDSTSSRTDDLHVLDNRVGRSSSKSTIPVRLNSEYMRRKSLELKERGGEEGRECDEPNDEANAKNTEQARHNAHSYTRNALPEMGAFTGRNYVSAVDLGTERRWPLAPSCEEYSSIGSGRSKVFTNSVMAPPNPSAIFEPLSPDVAK